MNESIKIIAEKLKEIGIFKRERTPHENKMKAFILWLQGYGLRDIAKEFSVSHEAVRKWLKKISDGLEKMKIPKRKRKYIALDDSEFDLEGKKIFIWTARDVETKEILGLKITLKKTSRMAFEFIMSVLELCEGEPIFIVDKAPWLCEPLKRLGVEFINETRGRRNIVERTFCSVKRRLRLFLKQISVKGLEVFCILFLFWYNFLKYHQGLGGVICDLREVISC